MEGTLWDHVKNHLSLRAIKESGKRGKQVERVKRGKHVKRGKRGERVECDKCKGSTLLRGPPVTTAVFSIYISFSKLKLLN